MQRKPQILPAAIERHAKIKAWNEYIIQYFGLVLAKRNKSDYSALEVFQGSFKLFDCYDFQLRPTTNAEMHSKLHNFLKQYLQAIRPFGNFLERSDFKPPTL